MFIKIILLFSLLSLEFLFAYCPKGISIPADNGRGRKNMRAYANNHDYDHLFVSYGKKYGFDPWLLKSMAVHESYLNHRTPPNGNDNGSRDAGLMRINSTNTALFRKYGISFKQVENPAVAVRLACEILRDKVRTFGGGQVNLRSISAYNGSQNCSNRAYYYGRTIMGIYRKFKRMGAKLLSVNGAEFPVGNYAPLPNANNSFASDLLNGFTDLFSSDSGDTDTGRLRDQFNWKVRMH